MATEITETKADAAEPAWHSVTSIVDPDESPELREKLGTINDRGDMNRLGKIQQLRVSLL
jgi:hypothetical protein